MQATQYYPPNAIYCMTPTTEQMARAVALRNKPTPVERWELPEEPPRRRQKQLTMHDVDHDGWDDEGDIDDRMAENAKAEEELSQEPL